MTQLIAMLAGPYLLVTGAGFLLSAPFYARMLRGTGDSDPVLLNLSGAVHFLAGLLILVQHSRWGSLAELIVTLVGLAAALKGAALIALPELILRAPRTSRGALRLSAAVFLAIGAYLTVVGFWP